jgi:PKD repeat protein
MVPTRLGLLFALALFAACGKDGNPVALPTDPGGGNAALTIGITSDTSEVLAGPASTNLTVTVVRADGVPLAAGTEVTMNTNLGGFGRDADGKLIQLFKVPLTQGRAIVQFFPGDKVGVANILAQIGTTTGRLNLTVVALPPPPVADFEFTKNGLAVLFADASTGAPTQWKWDFGDQQTSSEKAPQHTYAAAGSYTVTLTASNAGGQSLKSKFVAVDLGTAPVAAFTFTVSGSQVNFVDKSVGATSWGWTFGDSGSSNARNPVHTYAAPGAYTVVLMATNAAGTGTSSQVVTIEPGAPPVSKFEFTPTGLQVNFIDKSTGDPTSWLWEFGDGNTSTVKDPIHTYAAPGAFTVGLTVTNSNGFNKSSQVVTVTAGKAPVAAFEFKVNAAQVNFTDKSTGDPTSWSWSFGDGGFSAQQNPVHTYGAAGNYTVTLTAMNAAGSNSASQIVTIAAQPAPVAAFTYAVNGNTVNFVDRSTGGPTSWSWSFGDGSPASALQNPVHSYAAAGNYTVTLTVSNTNGSTNTSQVVTISKPQSSFTFSISGSVVNFVDTSTGSPTSWAWTFGDGGTSTLQNPAHTYAGAGSYVVSLTVSNALGSTQSNQTVVIK